MTCECGGERHLYALNIAHLSDENHIRALPHHMAQRLLVARGIRADLALRNAGHIVEMQVFDGVLDRDHVNRTRLIDLVNHRGERRALS